jgi:glycosyltransferase involved in cell wall biosynthesis
MRVLHVLTRAHRRGAETFGLDLHEQLLERGVASRVVALAPAPPGQAEVDVPVLGRATRGLPTMRALRTAARDADVVVAHGSDTLLACRLALLGARTPFVYVNIGDPLHWTASTSRRLRVRWMLRGAAAVGAIAPSAVERLTGHLGVPADRVHFTGNGRRSDVFRPATPDEVTAARALFALPPDAPVAVVVAALAPEKRLDVAVAAVASLPDWHLLLAGGGPEETGLAALADRLAPGRVHLAGSLTDVRPALHAADVALLTSTTEGLPGSLVEAAMSGLPVVGTDVGFVRDVVVEGRTGRLVAVGDVEGTAAALAACRVDATRLGEQGRAHVVALFESDDVVGRWLDVLDKVTRTAYRE